ncbi:MAG: hypothetical protein ACE5IR_20365 [bacterium]
MKVTMVIPSYWSRESNLGFKDGDAIYDHPTPLDCEGTLLRTIESINGLRDKDFRLVVIAAPTAEDIATEVEEMVAGIVKSASASPVEMLTFAPSNLKKINNLLIDAGKEEYANLIKLRGYSNIRNLCLFIPHILNSEVALLIDDDEVFEDPDFVSKAKEFIGKKHNGVTINGIAGYYLQQDGSYRIKKTLSPWMEYWDQYEKMNAAFDKIIGAEPRIKKTPFVFGGNMAIHRNLFTVVPFDPNVPRGEDIDYLINARMFGFHFFLDNRLAIKHLPPPKTSPVWMGLREDIYRFVYERAKIRSQRQIDGMVRVSPDDFDPYPGAFLKEHLEEKIEKSSRLLSEEYLAKADIQGSKEALNNIALSKADALPKFDAFQNLCKLQKQWHKFMEYSSGKEIHPEIKKIIESGRMN